MLPTLACKSLIFFDEKKGETETAKEWTDVLEKYFYPKELSTEELIQMKKFEYQPNIDEAIEKLGKASLAAYGVESVAKNLKIIYSFQKYTWC
uniref:Uncharacterized protein n=1 Tax=Panagrolaimus sp. ES5 TaxID=591445 RepID=A0AC34FXH8_9BILA